MPAPAIHFQIALTIAPDVCGEACDDATRAALLLGSVAPDMGYFPGGLGMLSDMVHYVRGGALVRQLARQARGQTALEAFAAGFATHVLADIHIHPLVNRGVAALLHREQPVPFCENPAAHLRVELGLDSCYCPQRWPAIHVDVIPFAQLLEGSFRAVYGSQIRSPQPFERSLKATVRGVHWYQGLCRRNASLGTPKSGELPAARRPVPWRDRWWSLLRWASAPWPTSRLAALTQPVFDHQCIDACDEAIEAVVQQFRDGRSREFHELPDYNLDTGRVADFQAIPAQAIRDLAAADLLPSGHCADS